MRRRLAIVALWAAVLACSDPAGPPEPPPVPPITGAQLDSMQRSLRAARLTPVTWASVELSRDDTRGVVHARVDGLTQEGRAEYCRIAIEALEPHLLSGQRLEFYLIDPDDGVFSCRNAR
jgi:hypothetical protein